MSVVSLVLLAVTSLEPSPSQRVCAREVGATSVATRLSQLPPSIREDIARLKPVFGDHMADSDAELLQTDAPRAEDGHRARVRFAQAMLVGDHWFVQFEIAMWAGVRTASFRRQADGSFAYAPVHDFGGPACASIKAALEGVTTPAVHR